MALFVCNGNCEACSEAETCPVKGEMKTAEKKFLTNHFGGFANAVEDHINKMEPDDFIRIVNLALFNLMQVLDIENKESGHQESSGELIEKRIEALLPENMRNALERFRQGDANLQNDPRLKKIVKKLLPQIAEKISLALQGKCDEKCASCFLRDQCTISHEGAQAQ